MKLTRTMGRLIARMIIGAGIGIAIVILYFTIDYVGQSDKRLYFIDNRDAFITILTMGVLIGVIIGIGWANGSKDQRM